MVRNPCCEKMGVKKGPWTPEEDEILVSYIRHFGHDNWRALPRQAGLLRCGKSCRLRWNNYLRPDIKRGNFTPEEEETISNLHQLLGNRWSAIATKLPGRTDNEIKNLWHTRLKKRDKEMSKSVPHDATIFLNSMKIEVPRQKICDSPTSSSDHQMIQIAPMHQQQPVVLHQIHHINVIHNSELTANEAEQGGGHNFQKLHYQNSDVSNENMMFWYNVLKNAGNTLN